LAPINWINQLQQRLQQPLQQPLHKWVTSRCCMLWKSLPSARSCRMGSTMRGADLRTATRVGRTVTGAVARTWETDAPAMSAPT
jgi:hypothetical protein